MKKHHAIVVALLFVAVTIATAIVLVAANDEPTGTKTAEGGCLVYEDGRLEEVPEGSVQSCRMEDLRGVCSSGTSTCLNREWADCQPLYNPTTETCDGLDNNCDGVADEDCP